MAKVLFLDESGTNTLEKIDPAYPMFVLGGVIVEQDYAYGEMTERVNEFKRRLLGRDDIVLHTADICRTRKGFESLKDPAFREHFYTELNTLMRSLEYMVVACAIKPYEHQQKYGSWAADPYMYSLEVLIERFCFEVGYNYRHGFIVAEKRNAVLDTQLDNAWTALLENGTTYRKGAEVAYRIADFCSRHKRDNIIGLQIADLVVTPIGRYLLGKPVQEDFRIVEDKFRRHPTTGSYQGRGLVILP